MGLCLQLDRAGGTQGAFVGSLWHPSSAEHCQPEVDPTDGGDRGLGSQTSQHVPEQLGMGGDFIVTMEPWQDASLVLPQLWPQEGT